MSENYRVNRFLICTGLLFFLTLRLIAMFNTADSFEIGKKLFTESVHPVQRTCIGCHSSSGQDTFSFMPGLFDIRQKYLPLTVDDLRASFELPNSELAARCHDTFQLNDTVFDYLMVYFAHVKPTRESPKILVSGWIIFMVFVLFITVVVSGIYKTFGSNPVVVYSAAALLMIILTVSAFLLVDFISGLGLQKNHSPLQPIKFSHKTHYTGNRIDCYYCHSNSYKGKLAGIPSVNICMNCHLVVQEGRQSGAWEISKVVYAYQNRRPLVWNRVCVLPGHVAFRHDVHCSAGKVNCTECHQDVEQQHRLSAGNGFPMMFCIECHRKSETMVNKRHVPLIKTGGLDCITCHH